MNAITVDKKKLLDTLRANRERHARTFEQAAEGYRQKVVEVLEDRLSDARRGKMPNLFFNLPMPVNQTASYDRVIGMLELELSDTIELEEHDYKQYVLDEWSWSAADTATKAMYTSQDVHAQTS